jgi:hypothetical protein
MHQVKYLGTLRDCVENKRDKNLDDFIGLHVAEDAVAWDIYLD